MKSMIHTLIIGYGNPLRGDDGLGWVATELLADMIDPARVEIITCHQLTPDLAAPISRAQQVIFIDAAVEGTPGEVQVRPLTAPPTADDGTFTHHLDTAGLLELTTSLYQQTPVAHLVTVCGYDFSFREGLSDEMQASLDGVILAVMGLIQSSSNAKPDEK